MYAFSLKNFFSVLLALIMSLISFFKGSDTGSTGGGYSPADPPSDPPEVVLAIVYSNYAWGYRQDVTVVTSDGSCYGRSVSVDGHDDDKIDSLRVDTSDYSALTALTKDPANALNKKENMDLIWTYYPRFSEWSGMSVKDYGSMACDYGTRSLYGYYKAGKEIKRVEIAETGDWQSCVDDKDAIKFAREMLPDFYDD